MLLSRKSIVAHSTILSPGYHSIDKDGNAIGDSGCLYLVQGDWPVLCELDLCNWGHKQRRTA